MIYCCQSEYTNHYTTDAFHGDIEVTLTLISFTNIITFILP